MPKGKLAVFSIADDNNYNYYNKLKSSLSKFHPEIDLMFYGQKKINEFIKNDPHFFYRATPTIAKTLIRGYDLVVKIDADSIITGKLDYILESDYEVGTVLNFNPQDAALYGEIGIASITPQMYFNCGLVAMRSKKFVDHWYDLCMSHHFERTAYREQGLLNLIAHYNTYKVRCFDIDDELAGAHHWYGLASKSEWLRAELRGDDIVIPASPNYNQNDKTVKVLHFAEGNRPNKMDYHKRFPEPVIRRINQLVT